MPPLLTSAKNILVKELDTDLESAIVSGALGGLATFPLGNEQYSAINADDEMGVLGYIPFTFNSVSKVSRQDWYDKCGDQFDASHVAAGQVSLIGTDNFYPTPVPGSYGRSALPDLEFTEADIANNRIAYNGVYNTNVRDGSKFQFNVLSGATPTGMTDGSYYWLRFDAASVYLYSSESDAISSLNELSPASNGSGTFKLTQAGIAIDDALEDHTHGLNNINSGSTVTDYSLTVNKSYSGNASTRPVEGATTTNETRPVTYYEFGYIKAENVIPFEGTPVSGVKYDTGWIANSVWGSSTINISHGLNERLTNVDVKFFISGDGSTGIRELSTSSISYTTNSYGLQVLEGSDHSNDIILSTGVLGLLFVDVNGTARTLNDDDPFYYKVIVEKKNYISPILDQPKYTNKVETLGDGDSVSLTAQNTIINIDSTEADATITITGIDYDGQNLVVNNIGTANNVYVIDSTGGFPKQATVPSGQSASCFVANSKLTQGNFIFTYIIGVDIPITGSGWSQFSPDPDTHQPILILCNSTASMKGLMAATTLASVIAFTLPEAFRPKGTLFIGVVADKDSVTQILPIIISQDGSVDMRNIIPNAGASWGSLVSSWAVGV